MADQFNNMPQQPSGGNDGGGSGMGMGLIIGLIVIILVVLAVIFFWPEEEAADINTFNDTEPGMEEANGFGAGLQGDAPVIIDDDFPTIEENNDMGGDFPVSDGDEPLIIE